MTGFAAGQSGGRAGGSFFSSTAALVGNTVIVAGASNINGVVVRSALLQSNGAGAAQLMTGAVPTTQTSNQTLLNGAQSTIGTTSRDIFVPPGQGLHLFCSGATGIAYLGYDIL